MNGTAPSTDTAKNARGQQRRLRESKVETRRINRRLQMVIDAVPLPFVELDMDDRVRRLNLAS